MKLSARYAELLPKAGVGSVWIEDELGEAIDVAEPLTPETRAKVHRATGDAISAAGTAPAHRLRACRAAVVESLADVAGAMVDDLLDCPDAALALDDLSAFDDYTHRHSVQVTVLGLLIARRAWSTDGWIDYRGRRRYDRLEDRMRKLGLGLLVHDVGKLAVPPEILNKPGRLTDDEMDVMKTHAARRRRAAAPRRPLAARALGRPRPPRAHRRLRLPRGPRSAPRSRSSRASPPSPTSTTPSRPSASTSPPRRRTSASRVIRDGSGDQFCPNVVRHFRAVVMPYPVGHEITAAGRPPRRRLAVRRRPGLTPTVPRAVPRRHRGVAST